MTVLKAFSDMPDIGARKFPAAPEASGWFRKKFVDSGTVSLTADNIVNPSKFLDRFCNSLLQGSWLPNIGLSWDAFTARSVR